MKLFLFYLILIVAFMILKVYNMVNLFEREKIRNRRLDLKLTLEEVGNICGVSKSTVKKWENLSTGHQPVFLCTKSKIIYKSIDLCIIIVYNVCIESG